MVLSFEKNSRFKGYMLSLPIAFMIEGCSFLKETVGLVPTRPKVELQDLKVKKFSWQKIDLLADLKLQNPNSFDLDLADLNYKVYLGSDLIAEGVYKEEVSIPSRQVKHVRLPLALHSAKIFNLFSDQIENAQQAKLRFQVRLTFGTVVGAMEFDFEETKSIGQLAASIRKL